MLSLANYQFMTQLLWLAVLAKILTQQSGHPFRPRHGYGCPDSSGRAASVLWSPSPFLLNNHS